MEKYKLYTKNGYDLSVVVSAMQKAIRRGDAKMAGYWGIEMFESNFGDYCWRRLLTISAEDCWGIITQEVESLMRAYHIVRGPKKIGGGLFIAKAIILLALAKKSRDADHLINYVHDQSWGIKEEELIADIEEARKSPIEVPEYAYDVHTAEGRRNGKTRKMFFKVEYDALQPKQEGLFDDAIK